LPFALEYEQPTQLPPATEPFAPQINSPLLLLLLLPRCSQLTV
jgi:hypothetical protein